LFLIVVRGGARGQPAAGGAQPLAGRQLALRQAEHGVGAEHQRDHGADEQRQHEHRLPANAERPERHMLPPGNHEDTKAGKTKKNKKTVAARLSFFVFPAFVSS
jgi:hypothetical protein